MKTFYIYLLGAILTLFPGYAFAYELNDTDANIIGHVTDKDTKEHLAYVTIMLKGTTIGTTTDETGHYFLKNLPEGTFTVEVSSIGYKTERRTVQLTKGKTLELNFEIGEDHVALEGVVVSANTADRRKSKAHLCIVSTKECCKRLAPSGWITAHSAEVFLEGKTDLSIITTCCHDLCHRRDNCVNSTMVWAPAGKIWIKAIAHHGNGIGMSFQYRKLCYHGLCFCQLIFAAKWHKYRTCANRTVKTLYQSLL